MPLVVVASWIIVGLLIGFIASKFAKSTDSPGMGMIVAGLGAVLIGAIYTGYSHVGVTAFVPRVLMFAAIGAVVAAIIWNVARARFGSREVYTPRSSY